MQIEPFQIAIPDADLLDLAARLARTRMPVLATGQSHSEGIDPDFLARILQYWSNGFDWRAHEARLNRLPQFLAHSGAEAIHFIHQPGTGPAPMPLILTHGWPGSFLEMEGLIPLLADPGAHGGDPADAFHVVVPSLPGFGFSSAPAHTGTYETAALWRTLMATLGYARFGAQGGDLGAGVSAWMGQRFPDQIIGMHLNWMPGSYRPPLREGAAPTPTPAEAAFHQRAARFASEEGAYASVQGTKPITLAAGLNDSPAGLAAWIAEKFAAWSQDFETTIGLDTLLANISLYWFTQTIGTSFRMYVEGRARPFAPAEPITPPLGMALLPAELPMPPRSLVERGFNLQRWTGLPAGGHFAALEQPALLAEDIRAFFRPLRAQARV